MTIEQKITLKLKIIKEFNGLHFTVVEVLNIFDELKGEISNLVVEQELKKLKFKNTK